MIPTVSCCTGLQQGRGQDARPPLLTCPFTTTSLPSFSQGWCEPQPHADSSQPLEQSGMHPHSFLQAVIMLPESLDKPSKPKSTPEPAAAAALRHCRCRSTCKTACTSGSDVHVQVLQPMLCAPGYNDCNNENESSNVTIAAVRMSVGTYCDSEVDSKHDIVCEIKAFVGARFWQASRV